MRVIMSMNVLMPSWSYLLLMSNVLFIHSLGSQTAPGRGARARDVTKTPATGLDDSASLSRLSGRRFVPCTPDARCKRLMHRYHPRRRDPHPGPARATRELPARAETRDSSPSRLDGGCSHRAASSRGAQSRRSEVVGADVVAVHRFSAPRRAAPGHAPPLV